MSSKHLPRSLRDFVTILLLLTGLCAGVYVVNKYVRNKAWPYNRVFTGLRMNDLDNIAPLMPKVRRYEFLAPTPGVLGNATMFRYPAPAILPYSMVFAFHRPKVAQTIFIFSTFLAFAVLLGRAMLQRGASWQNAAIVLVPTVLLSYPMWFEWVNGNIEIFCFAVLGISIWAYIRGRLALTAVCFGLMASIKIYPAIFLGLFLARRQYRAIALSLLATGVITVACLAYVTPSISYSWHALGRGMDSYSAQMFIGINDSYGYDHSLMMIAKRIAQVLHYGNGQRVLHLYMATAAILGTAAYFVRIRRMPFLNQLFLLTTAAVFLPPSSYDYTLAMQYFPWALFVLYAVEKRDQNVPGLRTMFVYFALLLAPVAEFIYDSLMFGELLRGVVFLFAFRHALRYDFPSTLDTLELPAPLTAIRNSSRGSSYGTMPQMS